MLLSAVGIELVLVWKQELSVIGVPVKSYAQQLLFGVLFSKLIIKFYGVIARSSAGVVSLVIETLFPNIKILGA